MFESPYYLTQDQQDALTLEAGVLPPKQARRYNELEKFASDASVNHETSPPLRIW